MQTKQVKKQKRTATNLWKPNSYHNNITKLPIPLCASLCLFVQQKISNKKNRHSAVLILHFIRSKLIASSTKPRAQPLNNFRNRIFLHFRRSLKHDFLIIRILSNIIIQSIILRLIQGLQILANYLYLSSTTSSFSVISFFKLSGSITFTCEPIDNNSITKSYVELIYN